jgi:hypothetical protein
MILLRRLGRERQATLPIAEARAVMLLLYDDFATFCESRYLEGSLQVVLDRLEIRARHKDWVELLPLPTGARDLHRFRRLFRYTVYTRYYKNAPETQRWLRESGMREILARNPRWLDEELALIARRLQDREPWVYGSRSKDRSFTGHDLPARAEPAAEDSPPEPGDADA